jgi:hypothetical protein
LDVTLVVFYSRLLASLNATYTHPIGYFVILFINRCPSPVLLLNSREMVRRRSGEGQRKNRVKFRDI